MQQRAFAARRLPATYLNDPELACCASGAEIAAFPSREDMMKYSLDALTSREPMPGFHGRFIHTDNMSFAYWDIEAGAILPEHSHPHEQVVNMLDGELELVVDGVSHSLRAGDVLAIPGGAVHSGRSLTPCRVLDVFWPVRMDYKTAE
jgi:quercetin dioxygenase-like cupin family protein